MLNFVKQGLRNWPMCMIPMFSHNARNEHIIIHECLVVSFKVLNFCTFFLLRRISLPDSFVDMLIGRLRSDDVYNQVC